jgi:hypothetical protein
VSHPCWQRGRVGGQDTREGGLHGGRGHRAGAYTPSGKAVTKFLIRLFIVPPPMLGGYNGRYTPLAVQVCVVPGWPLPGGPVRVPWTWKVR